VANVVDNRRLRDDHYVHTVLALPLDFQHHRASQDPVAQARVPEEKQSQGSASEAVDRRAAEAGPRQPRLVYAARCVQFRTAPLADADAAADHLYRLGHSLAMKAPAR